MKNNKKLIKPITLILVCLLMSFCKPSFLNVFAYEPTASFYYTNAEVEMTLQQQVEHEKERTFSQFIKDNLAIVSLVSFVIMAGFLIFIILIKSIKRKDIQALLEVDQTTGLMTKYKFLKEVNAILKDAKPNEYVLISFDVDHFKAINRTYGFENGNKFLHTIAVVVKKHASKDALICHYRDDIFLVFTKMKDDMFFSTDCKVFSQEKSSEIMQLLKINTPLHMSVGVHVIDNPAMPIEIATDYVRAARTMSKRVYGNSITVCSEEMKKTMSKNVQIYNSMDIAIQTKEFFIVIQPKIELLTGRLTGGEVLVRWKKADGTYIYPDEFVPLFEENQFIAVLDRYVFEEACRFVKNTKLTMPRISVNISAVTARSQGFLQSYIEILKRYNLSPSQFELELTESAVANNFESISYVCSEIKKAGFYLSIDDFGVGASSLSRIKELEADVIKLDKGFLAEQSMADKGKIVIESIISMANSLGFITLAEGIETKANLELMIDLGCDMGQGYLFDKPLSTDEFTKRVIKDSLNKYSEAIKSKEKIKGYLTDFEHLPYGIAITKNDAYSTVVKANEMFYKIIGHTKHGLMEKHQNRLTNISLDNRYAGIEKIFKSENSNIEFDLRVRKDSGDIVWVHDYVHYDKSQDLFFVTVTDITNQMMLSDLELSFDAYLAQKESINYLGKNIKEYILICDLKTGKIVYLNNQAMEYLGYTKETDWKDKNYYELGFGSEDNVDTSYYEEINEEYFTTREYFNSLHNMYLQVKNKIINVGNKKMQLNIVSDITAQKKVQQEVSIQETLNKCVEYLYTATTKNTATKDTETTFKLLLEQIRVHYNADKAYFYKFKKGSTDIESNYEVLIDGVVRGGNEFSLIPNQIKQNLIKILTEKGVMIYNETKKVSSENVKHVSPIYEKYKVKNFIYGAVKDAEGKVVGFMGVDNPKKQKDDANLMVLLSRFVWLFVKNEDDKKLEITANRLIEESIANEKEFTKLEEISKINMLEKCRKNLQKFDDAKSVITDILRSLRNHYGAHTVAILEIDNKNNTCSASYESLELNTESIIENYQNRPLELIENLISCFNNDEKIAYSHMENVNSVSSEKAIWLKLGIKDVLSAPMYDRNNKLNNILCVSNITITNRSKALIYVVAKYISDYLERMQIYSKTMQDSMTGLLNRKSTEKHIQSYLENGFNGVMFIVDIDSFKVINDTFGHLKGDEVIINLAMALKQIFRSTDILGRIGGDEFMVFCPDSITKDLATEKAKDILKLCNVIYNLDDLNIETSVSIGISQTEINDDFQSLYSRADKALYQAKEKGKNQYYLA